MKDLQNYFKNKPRFLTDANGVEWILAKDAAKGLNYSNTNKAIKTHCLQPVELQQLNTTSHPQGIDVQKRSLFINRADFNRLVLQSKMPKAKEYEAWVMGEVLPEIQDTGSYIAPDANREEVVKRIRNMKATRKSIDEQRLSLVQTIEEILVKENVSAHAASMMVANVTDAIYQLALMKTASHIKYEQIMAGGVLALITTNQLRKVESEHTIDFERALNYMNDSELEEVKLVFNELSVAIEGLGKRKFVDPTKAKVKDKIRKVLVGMWDDIDDSVKAQYADTLVHHAGVPKILEDINKREDKRITEEDQEKARNAKTRKAPFMN